MTLVTEAPKSAPSLSDSSEPDFDFSALPDAAPANDQTETTSDDRTPETKICPTCGEPIYREPGSRGRMPKYHPNCRPSATRRVGDALGATRRSVVGDAKKGREADECIGWIKPKLVQGATALMLFNQYDGFVFMTAIPSICENLHGILVAHDSFRAQMLLAKGGGSILGLVISLAIPVAAICSNHGLIPSAKAAEIIKNLPIMLHKISVRLKEGEQSMNDMMRRVADQVVENEEKKKGETHGSTDTEAPDPDAYLRTAA